MTIHVEDSIATHVGSTEGTLDLFRENYLEPGAVQRTPISGEGNSLVDFFIVELKLR